LIETGSKSYQATVSIPGILIAGITLYWMP